MNKENFVKFKGQVEFENGVFVFKADGGKVFNIVKNELSRRLADSHELCIIEVPYLRDGSLAEYGDITVVCGRRDDPYVEGRAIAEVYGLHRVYSQATLRELDKLPMTISPEEYNKRIDLRDEKIVTIDPATAGDRDDAFLVKKNPDGTITYINAIADLDSTVSADSALFEHAYKYCNSNYLGLMVYPMQHEKISNGKNSLNEGEDREAICTIVTLNPDGSIVNYSVMKAIINVKKRFSYAEADYVLFGHNTDGDSEDHSELDDLDLDIVKSIRLGYQLAEVLKQRRLDMGAMSISDREVEFDINKDDYQVVDYHTAHTEKTRDIIEELALSTNMVNSQIARNLNIPIMYRNHDPIDKEQEIKLALALKEFGISLPTHPEGRHFQRIIDANKNKRLGKIIEATILKSLRNAYYSADNNGHVGVGVKTSRFQKIQNSDGSFPSKQENLTNAKSKFGNIYSRDCGVYFDGDIDYSCYAHMTSPIRRLSDLVNQKNIFGYILNSKIVFTKEQIAEIATRCTNMELLAKKIESEYNYMLMGKWAKDNIGQTLRGIVVSFGKSRLTLMTEDNLIFYLPYANMSDRGLARNLAHPFKGEKRRLKLGTIFEGEIEKVSDNRIICSQIIKENNNTLSESENLSENYNDTQGYSI